MRLDVSGQIDLSKLANSLRDAGSKQLGQEMHRGMRAAGGVIADEVHKSSDPYIPRGFERTFEGALESKIEVRLANGRRLSVVFSAKGRGAPRHVDVMDKGRLKHPVYGRRRRLKSGGTMANPWVTQSIRPGVISEPGRRAVPLAVRKIDDAAGRVAAKISTR